MNVIETNNYDSSGAAIPDPRIQRRGRSIRISLKPSKKSALASKLISMGDLIHRGRNTPQKEENDNVELTPTGDEPMDETPPKIPLKKHRSFLKRFLPSMPKSSGKKEDRNEQIPPPMDFELDGGINFDHILRDLSENDDRELEPDRRGPWIYDETSVVDGKIPIVYHVDYGSDDSLLMEILTDNSTLDTIYESDTPAPGPTVKVTPVPFGAIRRPERVEISDTSESSKTASSKTASSSGTSSDDSSGIYVQDRKTRKSNQRSRDKRASPNCTETAIDSISSVFSMFTGTTEEKNTRNTKKPREFSDSACWFGCHFEDNDLDDHASVHQRAARASQEALKRMLSDAVADGGTLVSTTLEKMRQTAVGMDDDNPIEDGLELVVADEFLPPEDVHRFTRLTSKQREEEAEWETFQEVRQNQKESNNDKETKYWSAGFDGPLGEGKVDDDDIRIGSPMSDM